MLKSPLFPLLTILFLCLSSFAEDKPPAGFEKVDVTIKMGAMHSDIRFDKEVLEVKAGQKVKIIFDNQSEMPHNVVILKRGTSTKSIGDKAMMMGPAGLEKHYIPESDKILAHTPIVMPGKSGALYFKAPDRKMVLPYLCTIPGHYLKMVGKLYIGEKAKKAAAPKKKNDEFEIKVTDKPYVYRTGLNIPGVGKRAHSIAVGLPGGMNIAFDAVTCQLTAAWTGKFLDAKNDWNGRGGKGANILGKVFYANKDHKTVYFPIKGGGTPKFRGYRMYKGNPVFICYVGPNKMTVSFSEKDGKLVQKISAWNTQYITYLAAPKAKVTAGGQPLVNGEITKPARPTDGMLILEVEIAP